MITFEQWLKESEDDQEQVMKTKPKSSFKRKATDLEPEDDKDDGETVNGDGTIGISS